MFRRFFETVVDQCQQAVLIWGKELSADATKGQANAAVSSLKPRFAIEAHLENLFAPGETKEQEDNLAVLPRHGSPSELSALASPDQTSLAEISLGEGHGEPVEREEPPVLQGLHPARDMALREELTKIKSERHDWIERVGEPNRAITRGTYQRMADFQVSTTDPDTTVMPDKGGGSHLGYHTHDVVDGGKARIILAALVTPSEVMENQPVLDLLWRTRFRWKVHPRQFTGDTTYGTAENIVALEEQHIRAYVPLPDFDKRTEFFGQRDVHSDAERDVYICPSGEELHYWASSSTEDYRR